MGGGVNFFIKVIFLGNFFFLLRKFPNNLINFHAEMMEKIESWDRLKICDEGGAGAQAQILIRMILHHFNFNPYKMFTRLVLRCRAEARKRFAARRSDVLVKLELLDNKHVQVARKPHLHIKQSCQGLVTNTPTHQTNILGYCHKHTYLSNKQINTFRSRDKHTHTSNKQWCLGIVTSKPTYQTNKQT